MKNSVHHRFIERDYLFNKMRSSTKYITDEQINNYLNQLHLDDLTFIFTFTDSGFDTTIIDNETDKSIQLDDLNTFAWNFYLDQVKKISVQRELDRSKFYINKIRDMLTKKEKFAKVN